MSVRNGRWEGRTWSKRRKNRAGEQKPGLEKAAQIESGDDSLLKGITAAYLQQKK